MSRLQGRYSEVEHQSLDAYEGRYEGDSFGYHSQYHYAANPQDIQHDHENKAAHRSSESQYKPTALRWPFLLTLLFALLTTLAFLIYATVSLPVIGSRDVSEHVEARSVYRSSHLVDPVASSTHTPTVELKTQRTEGAYRTASLQDSPPPFFHSHTESSNLGARAGAESVIFVSVLTTIPGSYNGQAIRLAETKPPADFGDIERRNIIAVDSSTPTEIATSSAFGRFGTKTAADVLRRTTIATPTATLSESESDIGRIGTGTVTGGLPDTTTTSTSISVAESKAESDFGRIGTRTVTEAPPDTTTSTSIPPAESKPESDFGKVGTKTVTEKPLDTTTSTTVIESIDSSESKGNFGEIESKTISEQLPSSTLHVATVPYTTLLQTSTLTNSNGQATATQVATITATPSVFVKTDSYGNPTATATGYPTTPQEHTAVYVINGGHYFIGTFLPTLVASILAILVQILDTNIKSFQPWHALTHEQGASGRDSLCLETGGWRSLVMGLRSLAGGHAVVFLASLLSLSSAVLIPVSASAIALDLRGDGCKMGGSSASNCAYVLSVSPVVARATISILAVMSLTTILLVIMVGRWHLGVYTNPWSMCTLASLSANPDVQRLVLDAATSPDKLKYQDFKLDDYYGDKGNMVYGIVAFDRFRSTRLSSTYETGITESPESKHSSPFFMLGIIGRLCSLLILSGVLILVLYYTQTGGDTAFERFIDGDSFGVRFLFTSLGVIISLLWSSFHGAVAIITPYQMLTERPRNASQSILLAPSTNAFSGLWHAARTRRLFLGLVSLASIFSQVLSVFLSNVPFQVTQTFLVYQLSAWTSVGIMSFMFLILLVSFFVKWPNMPVGPTTIVGAMYYVCNTSAIDTFEGLSTLPKKERDRTVTDMALMYELSETLSAEGNSRLGLNVLQTRDPYP